MEELAPPKCFFLYKNKIWRFSDEKLYGKKPDGRKRMVYRRRGRRIAWKTCFSGCVRSSRKNKPTFTPNVDCGDFVIIVNCDKVVLTGKKLEQKFYTYHTGYIGGLKQVPYSRMMAEKSDLAVYEAVKGMLPKNSLGRQMLTKLRVYKGAEHNHQAQQPKTLNIER